MASSDDESETLAQSVTNYSFEDDKGVPISFSILPKQCCHVDSVKSAVFLKGIADDGIQKIYKQVTEWKYQLIEHYQQPEISVLSKEKNWIKLLKPRKSYEDIVKSVLVTVNCLHFFKKHPETSGNVVWDKLWKTFSSYEVRPCESDLLGHLSLIRAAVKQDEALSKSEDMYSGSDAKKGKFIVDDDEDLGYMGLDVGDESDEEAELFDSVCSICDNGGELLCCEGRCIRSFHPTVDDGEDSFCESLGYTKSQVKAMQSFLCLNCQHKRHQCFACGELGSSDKSSGTEIQSGFQTYGVS
ncbi:hypothetical protein IFM89_013409 [Coptis chinensis]|uniref:RFTS domain-containing protein n=1 Tax=Coptis chinensis TaxID=261450 RepID=A0A835GYN6_9MAGN|nr:hypothetical protein IFM89_013409 [Coptis chinensis]